MHDIVFRNVGAFYYTEIKHGQSRVLGKLDSGSPITLFNVGALKLFLGDAFGRIEEHIKNSNTPRKDFKGYNGIPSTVYLCKIHNIIIDGYEIKEMYAGISLDYPIAKDGTAITKCLVGSDFIRCCEGTIENGGNIELTFKEWGKQKKNMLDMFGNTDEKAEVFVIDAIDR